MRAVIYGGRDFTDEVDAFHVLDQIHAKQQITAVIEGGAPGADRIGRRWGLSRGLPVETWDADWKDLDAPRAVLRRNDHGFYNARAGHDRNLRMGTQGRPQVGIEFPGGVGTADMKAILNRKHIEVIEA